MPRLPSEVDASISQCVTDCTWLVRRKLTEIALEMRDEFCHEWEVDRDLWNEKVDALLDYVSRKGETPAISMVQLMAVRYEDTT